MLFLCGIAQSTLFVLQVFVHVLGSTATVAHSEDDSGATAHDVAAGEDLAACRLHTLIDNDGVLSAKLQTLNALRHQRVRTDTYGHNDLVDVECHRLAFYGHR